MTLKSVLGLHPAQRDDIGDLVTRRPVPGPRLAQVDPVLFLNHHGPQTDRPLRLVTPATVSANGANRARRLAFRVRRGGRNILRVMHRMSRRLAAIALLALVVRAVTPAGFMLAAADAPSGRYLTVTFCEDHSTPAQVIDLDTGKLVDPSVQPSDDSGDGSPDNSPPCVFAGATPIAPPVQAIELVEFTTVEHRVFDTRESMLPGRGIAAPPPPSTGPPDIS